jgi:hypothetical protein
MEKQCVEEVCNSFKAIIRKGIKTFVPHKVPRKKSDPEYNTTQVKRLKLKVRKAYNRRKLGQQYQEELKRLTKPVVISQEKCTGIIFKTYTEIRR